MKTEILEKIASVVSEVCEVSVEQIRSHSKCAEDVDARCIFVHYCKVYGISNYTIMRYLHRQRTCVIDRYLANYYTYSQQSYMFRVSSTQVADKLSSIFPATA